MKATLDGIAEWQFDNPDSSKEAAIDWLQGQKQTFGIP